MKQYALPAEAEQYIKDIHADLCDFLRHFAIIPAPSCHEEKRTEYISNFIKSLGYEAEVDSASNVIWKINVKDDEPICVYMAHMDVVFPDENTLPFSEDENNMYCPGIGDDVLRLALLLFAAKFVSRHKDHLPGIMIVANTGEEGLGNLYGVRQLVDDYKDRISELITIDGNPEYLITRAVGSHRYKIHVKTSGGHSFNDFGEANAIEVLASIIEDLYKIHIPDKKNTKTTYNVGLVSGGTSVNTIAQSAEMLFEYRSDDLECLEYMKQEFERIINLHQDREDTLVEVKLIGDRPCGGKVDEEKFHRLIKHVSDIANLVFGHVPEETSGSTDANYPLFLGIPAVCAGAGIAHNTHTREEYIEKSSIDEGLRFVIALLLNSALIDQA